MNDNPTGLREALEKWLHATATYSNKGFIAARDEVEYILAAHPPEPLPEDVAKLVALVKSWRIARGAAVYDDDCQCGECRDRREVCTTLEVQARALAAVRHLLQDKMLPLRVPSWYFNELRVAVGMEPVEHWSRAAECNHPSSDGVGLYLLGEPIYRCAICGTHHISVRAKFDHTVALPLRLIEELKDGLATPAPPITPLCDMWECNLPLNHVGPHGHLQPAAPEPARCDDDLEKHPFVAGHLPIGCGICGREPRFHPERSNAAAAARETRSDERVRGHSNRCPKRP